MEQVGRFEGAFSAWRCLLWGGICDSVSETPRGRPTREGGEGNSSSSAYALLGLSVCVTRRRRDCDAFVHKSFEASSGGGRGGQGSSKLLVTTC